MLVAASGLTEDIDSPFSRSVCQLTARGQGCQSMADELTRKRQTARETTC